MRGRHELDLWLAIGFAHFAAKSCAVHEVPQRS